MRDRLARLKRKSKAYSKSEIMLKFSLNLWINSSIIFKNIDKYCGYNNKYTNSIVYIRHIKEEEKEREVVA